MAVAEATLKHSKELLVKEEKNCRALTSSKEEVRPVVVLVHTGV